MNVKIIEEPKEGKKVQREQTLPFEVAEKVLTKKRGWKLPEDSKFVLKEGKLVKKTTKKQE